MLSMWSFPDAVPAVWILAFCRSTENRLVRMLTFGSRHKHVRAYAFLPSLHTWVFYDVTLSNTLLIPLPDGKIAEAYIGVFTRDCDLVSMRVKPLKRWRPSPFTCVSAMKQLIGLRSGALRPDGLYRDCLAAGGVLLGRQPATGPGISGSAA